MNIEDNPLDQEDEQIEALNEDDISNAEEEILPIIPKNHLVQSQQDDEAPAQKSGKPEEATKSTVKTSAQKSGQKIKFRKTDFTNTKQILKARVQNRPNNLILNNSEYEDIVQRLVDSLPVLEQIKTASHVKEKFEDFQKEVEDKCEKLTLRAKIISYQGQKESLI